MQLYTTEYTTVGLKIFRGKPKYEEHRDWDITYWLMVAKDRSGQSIAKMVAQRINSIQRDRITSVY